MIFAAITQREEENQYGGVCNSLEEEYLTFFEALGITLFPVPNRPDMVDDFLGKLKPQVIILTGGGILPQDAYLFAKTGVSQTKREGTETKLIQYAFDKKIPLLGICRGMQMINYYLGGKVSCIENTAEPRTIRVSHPVKTDCGIFYVNNYHCDGIKKDNLSEELCVLAVDEPNEIVEAYGSKNIPVLGIQWHPEREGNDADAEQWFVNNFIKMIK